MNDWETVEEALRAAQRYFKDAISDGEPFPWRGKALDAFDRLKAENKRQAVAVIALLSALDRTEASFKAVVNGRPVRDMAENLGENTHARKLALKETHDE